MTTSDLELLPADPRRGVSDEEITQAAADYDGLTFPFGMHSAVGAARVRAVVEAVTRVLERGLGREVAVWTLLGGFARLERDGHTESSDTVVRETVAAALEPACTGADVAAFTDNEIGEVALLLSLRALHSHTSGFLKGLAGDAPVRKGR